MKSHPILDRLAERGVKLGMERVRQLLSELGEPHLAVPCVHIAGTNGKGSVCQYVTEALVDAGYRVGTYLSPHLVHVNERLLLDGVPIDDASLIEAIEALDRVRDGWGHERDALTWFEFTTVLAFQVFASRRVDVAVIETGLGGRLDATNVVSPLATAITSIGFDHMEVLGETLPQIAAEKAGILKAGAPCAVGPVLPEVAAVIAARAERVGAAVWWSGSQLLRERRGEGWTLTTPDGAIGPVRLRMGGAHQGANAAVAVGLLHLLRRQGLPIPDAAIHSGLARAAVAGRTELVLDGLVLDGSHNPEGTAALAAWLASRPRPASRILIFGMGSDREPLAVLGPLLPHFDEVVLTQADHPKALTVAQLVARLREGLGAQFDTLPVLLSDGGAPGDCLPEVYADADETVVAGSLYLVGEVRGLIEEGLLDGLSPGGRAAGEGA